MRVMRKIENIVIKELESIGALPCQFPVVQEHEIWQKTGRLADYGKEASTYLCTYVLASSCRLHIHNIFIKATTDSFYRCLALLIDMEVSFALLQRTKNGLPDV